MAGFGSFSVPVFDSLDYYSRPVIRDHSFSSNSDSDSEPPNLHGFSSDSEGSPHPVTRSNSSPSVSEPQDFGGYSCSFVSEPPDVYTCLICTFVAKDCQQIDCCGKIYCRQCLAENQKKSKKCPNCRKAGNIFNDKKSDREIKALKVKCDNLDNGCQWVGELRSLEEHVHTCGYGLTPCTLHCQEDDGKIVKILRKDLENHLRSECPRRKYRCPHCREMGEYKERTTLHMDSCPKVKVQCPNAPCQNSMLRCDVSIHRSLCDYEKIMCKFANIGCQETPFHKSLKDHQEDHAHHLPLIIDNSLVLEARNNEQDKHIQSLENRCKEQDTQIQTLEKRLRLVSSSLPFTFRMENYQRLTEEQTHFVSPPFYSSGYKFSARIFTGGNKKGSGNRRGGGNRRRGYGAGQSTQLDISVCVCLMKGENDDSLTWPFSGSVTVELLNQLEDNRHALVMVQFASAKGRRKSGQRVTDGETGKKCNWIEFNPDEIMNDGWDCHYLHEDSLVFRVSAGKPWLQCTFKH